MTGTYPQLRRWAWLLVLVFGAIGYLLVLGTLLLTDNLNYVPSLLLLGSLVVPSSVLVFAANRGRQRAPTWLVVGVVVSGGIIGTVAAGLVEYDVLQRLGTLPMLAVAAIEESAKLVVPIMVFIVGRVWLPTSGAVIGIASGMGFASLETMGYGLHALLATGSIFDVDRTLLLRGLLSPAGHIAWTGVVTAALWRVPQSDRKVRAAVVVAAIFLGVVGLHAVWDGSDNLAVRILVALASVTGLLMTINREP